MKLLKSLLLLALVVLAGCGFQPRGQAQLPFRAAYVEAPEGSLLAGKLRGQLRVRDKLAETTASADLLVRLAGDTRSKTILSLSGAGKVREYRLTQRLILSATASDGREILKPSSIELIRDFAYSDAQLLAKEAEEASLYRDMEDEALRQILRRLSFAKP